MKLNTNYCLVFCSVIGLHVLVFVAFIQIPQQATIQPKQRIITSGFLVKAAQKNQPPESAQANSQATPPQKIEPKPTPTPPKTINIEKTITTTKATTRQITQPSTKPEPKPKPELKSRPAAKSKPTNNLQQPKQKATKTSAKIVLPSTDATAESNYPPQYPRLSKRLGEEGQVILELQVLANGTVDKLIVKQSSGHDRLDQAALAAVQQWRYTPATRNGQAIAYPYEQPIIFSLQ